MRNGENSENAQSRKPTCNPDVQPTAAFSASEREATARKNVNEGRENVRRKNARRTRKTQNRKTPRRRCESTRRKRWQGVAKAAKV
ncbi:MAG: hypothetical protein IJZ10_02995 [Thermoguttaceae bacterium]|nr:hypothetical protein [Thermoguttaceae bacterium]